LGENEAPLRLRRQPAANTSKVVIVERRERLKKKRKRRRRNTVRHLCVRSEQQKSIAGKNLKERVGKTSEGIRNFRGRTARAPSTACRRLDH